MFEDGYRGINRGRQADGTFKPFIGGTARYRLADEDPLLGAKRLEEQAAVAATLEVSSPTASLYIK